MLAFNIATSAAYAGAAFARTGPPERDHGNRQTEEWPQGEERQPRADGEHGGCNQEAPYASIHQVHEGGTSYHSYGQQIIGCAGHHIAGRVPVVEFGRHPLKVLVELVS